MAVLLVVTARALAAGGEVVPSRIGPAIGGPAPALPAAAPATIAAGQRAGLDAAILPVFRAIGHAAHGTRTVGAIAPVARVAIIALAPILRFVITKP